jgi:hypothetical protein
LQQGNQLSSPVFVEQIVRLMFGIFFIPMVYDGKTVGDNALQKSLYIGTVGRVDIHVSHAFQNGV